MKRWITTIVAGLLVVLAVQSGLTTAATSTSAASASTALRGAVHIHLKGKILRPSLSFQPVTKGRFTLSGAVSDRGRFVDERRLNVGYIRTLYGAKGTIEITFARLTSNWRINNGTRAYALLRGRGRERVLYSPTTIDSTMTGTVSR